MGFPVVASRSTYAPFAPPHSSTHHRCRVRWIFISLACSSRVNPSADSRFIKRRYSSSCRLVIIFCCWLLCWLVGWLSDQRVDVESTGTLLWGEVGNVAPDARHVAGEAGHVALDVGHVAADALPYLSFTGSFVLAVGFCCLYGAYLAWCGACSSKLRLIWLLTAILRSSVAIFLLMQVLSRTLEAGWLTVAIFDGACALIQANGLGKGWLVDAAK